jgi:hypothetical protein
MFTDVVNELQVGLNHGEFGRLHVAIAQLVSLSTEISLLGAGGRALGRVVFVFFVNREWTWCHREVFHG